MAGVNPAILGYQESTISKVSLSADTVSILPVETWQTLQEEHHQRADELTAQWRNKRAEGIPDPIEDFLFTYYSYRPALMRRWHPGVGVLLEGSKTDLIDFMERRWYTHEKRGVMVDALSFMAERGRALDYIEKLLGLLVDRQPRLGCFGLHEWAMVYRQSDEELRHRALPLRLGSAETDAVVEKHNISCSHFDAYRFFTPEAKPLNALRPTREAQEDFEQPGCLHAGMDTYKWAIKLAPIVPGDLLLDTFELAKEIRYLDMQASPYDVSDYGLTPVAIETAEGKREYVAAQAAFADRAQALRGKLLEVINLTRTLAAQN